MKRLSVLLAVFMGWSTAAIADELIEVRHHDLAIQDSYRLQYLCLTREEIPDAYATPRFDIADHPINTDIAGPLIRRERVNTIFLTTKACFEQARKDSIDQFVGVDNLTVTPVSP